MKKTSLPLLLMAGLAGGCQSAPPGKQSAPPLPLVASHPASVGVRIPEVVRAYAVGAYIDPEDPSVRHDAHWIQRVESPARWDLRSPLPLPAPVPEPLTVAIATEPSPVVEVTVSEPQVASTLPVPLEPALVPNAEGVLDLTALAINHREEGNPFAVVPVANTAREVMLHLSGVIGGVHATAVLNDRLVETGDVVESLTVERIEDRSVLLRFGETKLRIPVGEAAVRVRLPL